MSILDIHQIAVLDDNYIYVAHDPSSGATAVIDPALASPVLAFLEARAWTLTHILNTHHHGDHTGGNLEIKAATGCTIIGSGLDPERIDGIDEQVQQGDRIKVGNAEAQVMSVPGHTRGHIAYWFEDSKALFSGDTLFALGCGRLFEGTADQMWASLSKFNELPDETEIFCAHEYTQSNGRFALSIDPHNKDLAARMVKIDRLRAEGKPTVPSTLGLEKLTNPFLRANDSGLQQSLHMSGAKAVDVFAEARRRKDQF